MSDYYPADHVTNNYGLSKKARDVIDRAYAERMASHPICELCRKRSSVRITPLGPIIAACMECIDAQRQEMIDDYHRWEKEYDEEQEYIRQQKEYEEDYYNDNWGY